MNCMFDFKPLHIYDNSGSIGGFQGFARYLWSSKVSDSQGIWSSWPTALGSYMVCVKIDTPLYLLSPDGYLESKCLLLGLKLTSSLFRLSCCSFNQLDLPEYTSKEQLQERLLLAIHEANEGFGFGWPKFNVILWPQQCRQSTLKIAMYMSVRHPFHYSIF